MELESLPMVCMPSQPLSAFGLGTRRARRPNVDSFCLEHRSAANSGAAGHSPHQLPSLHDIQVGWLLLFCCACPRTQCALRTLSTASTHGYATRHDAAVLRCLDSLLFADTTQRFLGKSPLVHSAGLLGILRGPTPSQPCSNATALSPFDLSRAWKQEVSCQSCCHFKTACDFLSAVGFEPPSCWHDALHGEEPRPLVQGEPQLDSTRGWQRAASQAVDARTRCLLRRPARLAGPYAARVFTARPTSPELSLEPPLFRALLLRRLRLTAARCGVANRMMPSEITLPLAHGLVCCARVGAQLSGRRPEYAGRRALLSRCTPWCVISMLSLSARTRDA